jgi:hypothetical protein
MCKKKKINRLPSKKKKSNKEKGKAPSPEVNTFKTKKEAFDQVQLHTYCSAAGVSSY